MAESVPTNQPRAAAAGLSGILLVALVGSWLPPAQATPGAMPLQAPSRSPQLQEDAYILGPGDGLALKFLGGDAKDPLSGPVEILSDGTVSLPLLGSVRLIGLTLSQATLWLQALYRRQLLRPELQLSLIRPRPLRVALVGEVERPGVYTLTSSETSNTEAKVTISGLPTLVDAIQKAGGITQEADLRQVVLRRRLPGEVVAYRRTRVNLLALVQDGDQVQNPLLFDGDTIKIEKATEPVIEATELAATTLAPRQISVNIVGEVERPGLVPLAANTPLVQAVLAAGGAKSWRANTNRVQLVRINRNGSVTRQAFALDLNSPVSENRNPPLRDRDTVVVGRTNYAKLSDAISAVGTPLTGLVNVLTLLQLARNSYNDSANP
ncbi:SLBB domain-containing protein [Cyanobium sp. ATX 6F1]|uniref:SLBB domain-containing protein n=1 Tax=unclassified Cyanobium TaxID=2627006 RepID=UPI0020CD954A|nr:SLBB domain-containing protein [Cyanobium sp. ATX 6F1]MCP9917506.1 SLBB domain-containing protein [Cyanobium sp. ATX 6F1]